GRMVLAKQRAVGLGDLPLWPGGFQFQGWMVLGAADAMGARVGLMAAGIGICRLGSFASFGTDGEVGCHRKRREPIASSALRFRRGAEVSGPSPARHDGGQQHNNYQ